MSEEVGREGSKRWRYFLQIEIACSPVQISLVQASYEIVRENNSPDQFLKFFIFLFSS